MSSHVFTENETEALAFLFLIQIRKMRKASPVVKRSGKEIFSELEDYIYNDVLGGFILNDMSIILDVIPEIDVDQKDAELFAEYLIFCLLRRSDEYAIKTGQEPNFEIDILVQFREVKHAFQLRESGLSPTLLSQDIVEILKRGFVKKVAV